MEGLPFDGFALFFPFMEFRSSCEQRVCGGIQACLAGVLNNTDDEANTNNLHCDIARDTKQRTSQRNQPPATPDAPHAETAATRLSRIAVGISTEMPIVLTVASVITVIVIAAPAMLIVAPKGIDTE